MNQNTSDRLKVLLGHIHGRAECGSENETELGDGVEKKGKRMLQVMHCSAIHEKQAPFVFSNWARLQSCKPKYVHHPETAQQILDILSQASSRKEKVKVVGMGHSPNEIAMTNDHMIFLDKYTKVLFSDYTRQIVKVESGISLKDLHEKLASIGMALPCLGSISDQTISGAFSTGTHGSGKEFGILSTAVEEMQLITAKGEILTLSEKSHPNIFKAALCGLGSLGVISTITLKCEPFYALHAIQEPLRLDHILNNLDTLLNSNEHYRFWWFPHTNQCVSWAANRVHPSTPFTNYTIFEKLMNIFRDRVVGYHLLQALLFLCGYFPQLQPFINKLYYLLLHARRKHVIGTNVQVTNFDCLFSQFVNEWAIPVEKTKIAMKKLQKYVEQNAKYMTTHFPVEIRFTKADDIFLSPSYGRDSCWIGILKYRPYYQTFEYEKIFDDFSQMMLELDGRPHWAKYFSPKMDHHVTEFPRMYPKWNEFRMIREQLDPDNMFVNDFLKRTLQVHEKKLRS